MKKNLLIQIYYINLKILLSCRKYRGHILRFLKFLKRSLFCRFLRTLQLHLHLSAAKCCKGIDIFCLFILVHPYESFSGAESKILYRKYSILIYIACQSLGLNGNVNVKFHSMKKMLCPAIVLFSQFAVLSHFLFLIVLKSV